MFLPPEAYACDNMVFDSNHFHDLELVCWHSFFDKRVKFAQYQYNPTPQNKAVITASCNTLGWSSLVHFSLHQFSLNHKVYNSMFHMERISKPLNHIWSN